MSKKQLQHDTLGGLCRRCGLSYSPKTAYVPCFVESDTRETWLARLPDELRAILVPGPPKPAPNESSDREVPGPCAVCGADELCAPHDGRPLCYDHWHAAREATTPYYVRREVSPEHDAEYGYMFFGGIPPSVLTQTEATEEAARLTASSGYTWVPVIAPNWRQGERCAHPGYMNRRRAALGGTLR
jgi:hypothetical protein